jgi:hypothetical protein
VHHARPTKGQRAVNPRARREPPKKRGRLRARSIWGRFSAADVAVDYEAILAAEGLAPINAERPQPLPFSHPKIPDDVVFPSDVRTRRDFVSDYRRLRIAETMRLVGVLEDILWGHVEDAPPLSDREHAVLGLYLDGLTTRQIAHRLRHMRAGHMDTVQAILRGICERHGLPPLRFERSE